MDGGRAIGELLICPYCLGWRLAGGFVAGPTAAPAETRWRVSTLVALTGADTLQITYAKAEQHADHHNHG
jgi:hypothetical protein